jgi:predicted anti-sigma-YlaC factor YlaD
MTDELTCRDVVELVSDYLESALAPAERARFDEHLAMCSGCRAYLDQMRITITTLGRLSEETVPVETQQALLAAFRDWRRG